MEPKKIATFQERFTELLESSPKSRTTIASEFHVAKQTISAWATGQTSPRLPIVMSLADYFDVDYRWLLGFDVPKEADHDMQRRYEQYYQDTVSAQKNLGMLSLDESDLVHSYRSLPDPGKQYIHQQLVAARLMFGEKSDSIPSADTK